MKTRLLLAFGLVAAVALTAYAADPKLDGVKCIVNPKAAAKAANGADFNGGKVFFCCPNCPKTFSADPAKFTAVANAQLVATGQAKQTACPISGQPCDEAKKLTVSGVEVCFCCDNCKGKVEKASPAEAAELVFGEKAFAKGFKVGEAK